MTIRKIKIVFSQNRALMPKDLKTEESIALKKDKVMYEYSNNASSRLHPNVSLTYLPSHDSRESNYKADYGRMCELAKRLLPCEDNLLCDAIPASVEIYYEDNTRKKIANLAVNSSLDPVWDELLALAKKYLPLYAEQFSQQQW